MSRVGWYARRLRSMGVAEVAWRTSTAIGLTAREITGDRVLSDADLLGTSSSDGWTTLLRRFRSGAGRPVVLDAHRAADLALRHPEQITDVIRAADRVAGHRFALLGHPEIELADPIDWHHDLATGVHWPAVSASRIDHRTHGGDAKWVWELNRLQHLSWLTQAWLVTGDRRYADSATAQLSSWLTQNPTGVGIAWRGAFEAGVRATSVAIALQGLRDAPGLTPDLFARTVRMLAESARRCWRDRSRFSSANNHVVGELGGLLTVAMLFPELSASPTWERRGLAALEAQHRQILSDGAGAEQSVGYQIYTADVFCLVIALLRARGDEPPPALVAAVRRGARYLTELVDGADEVPRYGDDDGSFVVRLDATPLREVRAHLVTAASVLGEPSTTGAGTDLMADWLGGAEVPSGTRSVRSGTGGFHAPHGGLVVLRSGRRRVTMDVGPLGYLTTAAHGHADALALTLMLDGRAVVTDPGTGSYYGHPEWRDEHRGTAAHATVSIDDLDQSVAGGAFLWSRHATVTPRHVDVIAGSVCAEHDGYRRLTDPVLHRRWLWAPPDGDVVVIDLIDGQGRHVAATSWPLHPDLEIEADLDGFLARRAGHELLRLDTVCSRPTTPYAVQGAPRADGPPVGGWWSDRLDRRVPAWRVGHRCTTDDGAVFATVLAERTDDHPTDPIALRLTVAGGTADVTWSGPDRVNRLEIDLTGSRPIEYSSTTSPAAHRDSGGH